MLGRVIAPIGRCLTPASAKEILALRADKKAKRRIENLASKCDEGTLTPEERAEYQLFVEVGDFVALLQAKARRYLSEHTAA
jgi:hypothetical protein